MASLGLSPAGAQAPCPYPSSAPVIIRFLLVLLCASFATAAANGSCTWQGWKDAPGDASQWHIRVDPSGQSGTFTTVQSAIDAVPENNNHWFCIYVKEGTYREKVQIPKNKPFIILKGRGKRKTEIVWDDHETVAQSPTFTSSADNIVVKSISFRNSYNNPVNENPKVPAAAAMILGDKSYFYRVGFSGLQDTLWDVEGRHYFKRCTIQGAVDFIFGGGQSIYEGCAISVLGNALPGLSGFITAQGRENEQDTDGFVFKNCNVFGSGSAKLGRPWRGYARVLFYHSNFTDVVDPKGWDAWSFVGREYQLTFVEYGCYGPGADMSKRVSWERKLDDSSVQQMTSLSYVDSEGWIDRTPF
ncbi:probable pectinesterase 29 [Eucalyptus grandis]|nr:probable pectinesterase 29 [Eucalyptus grandis]